MNTVEPNGALNETGFRFGEFEYYLQRRELRKYGYRVRLQPQPHAILLALLRTPGSIVRREELRALLWGTETFVEFEQGLNSAVKRLRDALNDSAECPRFIETVPSEGYRFVGEVERVCPPTTAQEKIGPIESVEVHAPRSGWRQWPLLLSAGAAVICAGAISLGLVKRHNVIPPVGANSWVLVTRFDNRTGEAQLENVLDFAFQSDLSNSRVIHVVAPERIQDTLRLMRKPPDAPIDLQTGREICLRDGGIDAVVTGRVDKIGGRFVLTASLMEPQTGAVLRSFRTEAESEAEVLRSVNQLSDQLRKNTGEALEEINKSNLKLEKVTTPSLRAVQLFSAGSALLIQGNISRNQGAADLFSQAIDLDPEFASAYAYLGWATLGDPLLNNAKSIESFRRAKDLADNASERERLFILQSWYELQLEEGDLDRAIHYGELLTNLYPDFYWGVENQANLLMNANRPDEAAEMYERALRLRPYGMDQAVLAAQAFDGGWQTRFSGRRPDLAGIFLEKAKAIAAHSDDPSLIGFWGPLIRASEKYGRQGGSAAAVELAAVRPSDNLQAHNLVVAYLCLGKLNKAEELARSAVVPNQLEMIAAFLRSGVAGLRSFARQHPTSLLHPASGVLPGGLITLMYARVGALGDEKKAIQEYVRSRPIQQRQSWLAAISGMEALNAGEYNKAIPKLRLALQASHSAGQQMFLADSLAIALEHEGRSTEAINALVAIGEISGDELWFAPFRPLVLEHLAALYRKDRDITRAAALEKQVRKLLDAADSDYSLNAQLGVVP